jgi:hypothetical protein
MSIYTAPALWDPATGRVYTIMINDRSAWGGQTLKELIADGSVSPESRIVPHEEGIALQEAADRERYCTGPEQITEERFHELLNILFPERWTRNERNESFRISEPLTGRLYTWVVRIGSDFYRLNEDGDISHQMLLRQCKSTLAPVQ